MIFSEKNSRTPTTRFSTITGNAAAVASPQVLGQFDSPCAQLGPDFGAPLRLAAFGYRAGKTLAPSQWRPKRQVAERPEPLGAYRVPGVGRQEQTGIVRSREKGVAEAPAVVFGNSPQAILQSLLDVLSTVGHRSYITEHFERRGPFVDLLLQSLRRLLPLRDIFRHNVDSDYPSGIVFQRQPMFEPDSPGSLGCKCRASDLNIAHRFALLHHAEQDLFRLICQVGDDFADRPADVIGLRQAVDFGPVAR